MVNQISRERRERPLDLCQISVCSIAAVTPFAPRGISVAVSLPKNLRWVGEELPADHSICCFRRMLSFTRTK